MNKHFLLFLTLLFMLVPTGFATTNLYVHAPHGTWRQYKANIEEVAVSVKPKGLYSEIGVYLTIGEKGNDYAYNDARDSLEIVMDFELPKEAVVTDTWLWVYGHIIQGKIMDKWTASSIYNGIVQQKKDPSIIYKQSDIQYQMRIYPLAHGENRKIKLNFLLPNTVVGNDMHVDLPLIELLRQSFELPETMKIILKPSPEGIYPQIAGGSKFTMEMNDTTYGGYQAEEVSLKGEFYFPTIKIPGVLSKGYYLTKYNAEDGENYYQVSSTAHLKDSSSRKFLVILDVDTAETNISNSEIATRLQITFQKYASKDSVKLIYAKSNGQHKSTEWSSGLEFKGVEASQISCTYDLFSLFTLAANTDDVDDIIFISTNNMYNDEKASNALKNQIIATLGKETPIHILDCWNYYLYNSNNSYIHNNMSSSYIGNTTYNNNDYLYKNIALNTGGIYRQYYFQQFYNNYNNNGQITMPYLFHSFIEEVLKSSGGKILKDFTLKTDLSEGWTFGEYNSKSAGQSLYSGEAISRIGKYKGTGNFEIDSYFDDNGEIIVESEVVHESEVFETDSTLLLYWYGHKIREMENSNPDRAEIKEIIKASTENRVLSRYTSFLCLEPGDTVPICEDCFDESDLSTPIAELIDTDDMFTMKIAEGALQFSLSLPEGIENQAVTLAIYNLQGKQIASIVLEDISSGMNKVSVALDEYNLASGYYVAVLNSAEFSRSLKFTIK